MMSISMDGQRTDCANIHIFSGFKNFHSELLKNASNQENGSNRYIQHVFLSATSEQVEWKYNMINVPSVG